MFDIRRRNLRKRAELLARARHFLRDRGCCEVDCPILSRFASVDEHIDLIPALYGGTTTCYLHSSPEYGMKRLLSEGLGDIYQISHVFRDAESGLRHNPEFTLAEWYRVGCDFQEMILETGDFIRHLIGPFELEWLTYRQLFERHCQVDPLNAPLSELFRVLERFDIELYRQASTLQRDDVLNFLLGVHIEPRLPSDRLTVVSHYPPSQAALAQVALEGDDRVAERFEIYLGNFELANGYRELVDAAEQRQRLEQANFERMTRGKSALPIDERFLEALQAGLPPSCGVAVGFDRLCMIACQTERIEDVLPFAWDKA